MLIARRSGPAKDSMKVLQSRLLEVETCLLKLLSATSDDDLASALQTFKEISVPSVTVSHEHYSPNTSMGTVSSVRQWQNARTDSMHNCQQATKVNSPDQEAGGLSGKSEEPARQAVSRSLSCNQEVADNQTEQSTLEPDVGSYGDEPLPPMSPMAVDFPHPGLSKVHTDGLSQAPMQSTTQLRPSNIDEDFDSTAVLQNHPLPTSEISDGPELLQHLFW